MAILVTIKCSIWLHFGFLKAFGFYTLVQEPHCVHSIFLLLISGYCCRCQLRRFACFFSLCCQRTCRYMHIYIKHAETLQNTVKNRKTSSIKGCTCFCTEFVFYTSSAPVQAVLNGGLGCIICSLQQTFNILIHGIGNEIVKCNSDKETSDVLLQFARTKE